MLAAIAILAMPACVADDRTIESGNAETTSSLASFDRGETTTTERLQIDAPAAIVADLTIDAVSQAIPDSATIFLDRWAWDRHAAITDDVVADSTIEAISARWDTVVVDSERFDPFDPETDQVRDGRVLVGVGTPELVRPGLISIPIGVIYASLGGSGTEYLFAFGLEGWQPITPEEAGVDVVSWIS